MSGYHTIYIGTQPDPEDRLSFPISRQDYLALPPRNSTDEETITNLDTGEQLRVRRASCGLDNCNCALEIVK